MKAKLALITGATSGIGLATAEALASRGANLVITGRRDAVLKEIASKLEKAHGVRVIPLAFDVGDTKQTISALDSLGAKAEELSILVNNAGLAKGSDPVHKLDLADVDEMIDTNVKGLLAVTRWCLPRFIARGEGHVVNVGSVAGRWTYPGGAVYCATKFAVRAISEGMRMDLLGTPVRVTNIEPGMVETGFSEVRFDGDKEKAKSVYKGMTPLTGTDIADTITWCLERPAHVNIQELVIYPTDQASVGNQYVHRR
ncbi:MAG: SDR family NAD(P)-dependent oxidoreductase [Bdellovibrionota bacterium]